jgi:Protein of unknown function (DUF3344)
VHVKEILCFGAALLAAVALVSSSGAGTAASRGTTRIDVSTRAAVVHYLRTIHVDPHGVVIQRGVRNYAGPNCPGAGWTCTSTAHPVVQVAPAGGKNDFQCSTAHCAVVQVAEAQAVMNKSTCVKETGITQSCSINQTSASADNLAIVYMSAVKTSGLTQNASQTAQIVQQATGGADIHNNNRACVTQYMRVDTVTQALRGMPVLAVLDGHQTLLVKQDSRYGNNYASEAATRDSGGSCDPDTVHHLLGQTQIIKQTATGSARIEQRENTADSGANLSLEIRQNQNGGGVGPNNTNNAVFSQDNTLTAIAKTPNGEVVQTQGTFNGGLQATVNQFAHGVSNADAHQTEVQCAHATASGPLVCVTSTPPSYSLTQTQWGQVRKGGCCSTQADNPGDTFTIHQSTTQDADTHSGQRNMVQGDCTTTGNCTANQHATIDGEESDNTQTGQNVNAELQCAGSDCTAFTVNGPQLSASDTNVKEFGFGGMRGDGTGSIMVSDVTGPVARALLYWNGPTNSSDPAANAHVTFNGTPVTGTNIGFASDNCWGFQNSQSYQADVTTLVTGNGTYSLSNFHVPPDVEVNGVSLVVFYNDADASNDRNVVLWSGNDSNQPSTFEPAGWDQTLTGVEYPGSGDATMDFIVSDGQTAEDYQLLLNGVEFQPAGNLFQGETLGGDFDADGSLWDVKSFDLTPFLVPGSNTLHLQTGDPPDAEFIDCLSLVAFAANVPASEEGGLSSPQLPQSSARPEAPRPAPVGSVPSGGTISRR